MQSETTVSLRSNTALQDELKRACGGDGKLQRSEAKSLLLKFGISISQAVLDDIFTTCDVDGDGSLTIDEIFNYIDTLQPKTWKDRLQYTFQQTTSSISWWFSLAFQVAAWIGVVRFVLQETTGKTLSPIWSVVTSWFFMCGAVYYTKSLWDHETTQYDTMVQAKRLLKRGVDEDESTFFDKAAGEDSNIDLQELNAVLEELSLYLPKSILVNIFDEIDTDKDGTITKQEFLDFCYAHSQDPTKGERQDCKS